MKQPNNQAAIWLSFSLLATYTLLSMVFSYERILNVDNSMSIFNIVNEQTFVFPENRWGILFSQIPLLIGVKLQLPLSFLIIIYAVSFPLLYAAIAFVCIRLKVYEAALAISLILVIGIRYSFYHPVTETYQAIIFGIFTYALAVSTQLQHQKALHFVSVITTSIFSLLCHPVAFFVLGFILLFLWLTKQSSSLNLIGVFIPVIIITVLRLILVNESSYDAKQYENLLASIDQIRDLDSMFPIQFFINRLSSTYFPFLLIAIAFSGISILSKQYLLFSFSWFSFLVVMLIATLTFSKGDADMMIEKSFMPAVFMIMMVFCYLIVSKPLHRGAVITIIIASFLAFVGIYKTGTQFKERLQVLEDIANQSPHSKIIIGFNRVDKEKLLLNHWNTGIDSYLLTASKSVVKTIFLTEDPLSFSFDSTDTDLFLGPTWMPYLHFRELNPVYFKMQPSSYSVNIPH